MAHIIQAAILKGTYSEDETKKYDLQAVPLDFDLTLFFIDDDFLTYWEKKLNIPGNLETNHSLPNKLIIYELLQRISQRHPIEYAIIATAYVGGMGDQHANVYQDDRNMDPSICTISAALHRLGVEKGCHTDEFDAVGLGRFRRNPDYLHKYHDLVKELL